MGMGAVAFQLPKGLGITINIRNALGESLANGA